MGGTANYSDQVNTALQQANQPKSQLAQGMSDYFQQSPVNYNNVLSSLGQIGNFNAFPGASTPGFVQNQYQQPAYIPPTTGGAGSTHPTDINNLTSNDGQTPSSNIPTGRIFQCSPSNPNFDVSIQGAGQFQVPNQSVRGPLGTVQQQVQNQIHQSQFLNNGNVPSNRPVPDLSGQALSQLPIPQGGIQPIQQANPLLTGLNTQQMNGQAFGTLLNQQQAPGISNFNPSANLLNSQAFNQQFSPLQGLGISGLSQALQGQIGANSQQYNPQQVSINNLGNGQAQGLQQAQAGQVNPAQFTPQQAQLGSLQQQYDPTQDPYYQGIQQSLQNQQLLDQKNLQAQFGASGGTGRGTPAAFAQAQLMAQQTPQMAAALGQVAQQEQANQLQRQQLLQSGALQNADMANQYGLAGNQLQAQTGLANISNQLQAAGLNQNALLQNQQLGNQFGLGQQSNQLQAQQANQQAGLQAAGLGNQQLGTLGNILGNNQGLQLQNYLGTIGANQNQLGLLNQAANQAGNLNLGQNQLGSQNQLNFAQLNSQNANNALQNQLGFQTNQNQAVLGQNNLLSQLGQFNAGQANTLNQQYSQQQQTANQNQINNQMQALQNLAQIMSQFGLSGIPGGSANVNLGAQSQSLLQSLGGLL